jgi:hypothetical protein
MRMADFDKFGSNSVADFAGAKNCDFHNVSFPIWSLIVLGSLPGSHDIDASRKQRFLPARPGPHP